MNERSSAESELFGDQKLSEVSIHLAIPSVENLIDKMSVHHISPQSAEIHADTPITIYGKGFQDGYFHCSSVVGFPFTMSSIEIADE